MALFQVLISRRSHLRYPLTYILGYNEPERPIKVRYTLYGTRPFFADVASKGLMNVVTQSLTMQGFIIFRMEESHPHLLGEFDEKVPSLIASGELKYKEEITQGLEKVGDVILNVQKGMNKGKAVILVAKD